MNKLAALIVARPAAQRYTISWPAPGRGPLGGYKPMTAAYNPKTRIFWDGYEIGGATRSVLQNVQRADIGEISRASGTFADLTRRVQARRRQGR